MKKLLIIILLLAPLSISAANVVECSWEDPIVPGRVLRYLQSVNTPDYYGNQYVIHPDVSHLEGIPTFFWKCSEDRINILEMTPAEKDTLAEAFKPPEEKIIINQKTGCIEFKDRGEICSGSMVEAGSASLPLLLMGGLGIAAMVIFRKKIKKVVANLKKL